MIVIFIAGASASGKTTLSDILKSHFIESLNRTCEVLRMDDYFKEAPEGCDLANYKETTNFTKLETRDLELLSNQILMLNDGNVISQPEYSFVTCTRSMTKTLHAPEFLIVEGTFVLHFANVMPTFKEVFNTQLSHMSIFVSQSDYEETLKRRITRNGAERGQSEEIVRRLDEQYLRPAFLNVMLPSAKTADKQIINDNREDLENSIDSIMDVLNDNLARKNMRKKDELASNTVVHDGSDTYFLGTGDVAARRLELQNAALLDESKKHIEKIPVLEGKVVWDIGCGSGAMTAYFAEKVGETGHVYAVDISEKQLEVTKKRIEKDGFTNVTFIRADIVSDGFPQNAADIVYMRFVLMHLCNPNQALDKIKDLLKPQGMFVSEEPINSSCYSPTDANAILKEYISAYVEMGRRRGVNYDIGSCLDNTLNKAGFANTEVTYTLVKIDAELGKTMLPMFLDEWKDEAIRTEVTTEERVVAWKETISHLTNSRQLLFGHAYTMARALGQKSESSLHRNEDDVDTAIIPEGFFR